VPAVDRVLCGGEGDDWASRAEALETLQRGAAPLIVVAGGGVDEAAASRLASGGVVREVHVGRTVRAGGLVEGVVEAEAVSRMVSRIAHAQSA